MADVYIDESHTNDGDGDGWSDATGAGGARNDLEAAIDAASAGDVLFLRAGGAATAGAYSPDAADTNMAQNAIRIYGVKAATTNTPPVQSDLIPGIATGDSTRAYDQTSGNAAPVTGSTDNGPDVRGEWFCYGVRWDGSSPFVTYRFTNANQYYYECEFLQPRFFNLGNSSTGSLYFYRCKFTYPSDANSEMNPSESRVLIVDSEFAFGATQPNYLFDGTALTCLDFVIRGSDLSAYTGNLILGARQVTTIQLIGCVTNSSMTISFGNTPAHHWRVILWDCDDGTETDLVAGESRNSLEGEAWNGTFDNDFSFTRESGASDLARGAFSRKMTPIADSTQEWTLPLEGIEEHFLLEGDGTSKTMTVYIANDGGADLDDDEIWVEVHYPSEDGDARHYYTDTRPTLLGTPNTLTDDTESDWNGDGAGSNNAQMIQVPLAPDYTGPVMWRVFVGKRQSSPDNFYYDPFVEIS